MVSLSSCLPRALVSNAPAGAADYFDWRRQQQIFTDLALTRIVGNFCDAESERIRGTHATANLFRTLGLAPLFGRTFMELEQLDPERPTNSGSRGHGGQICGRPGGDASAIRNAIREIDPNQPLYDVLPCRNSSRERFSDNV